MVVSVKTDTRYSDYHHHSHRNATNSIQHLGMSTLAHCKGEEQGKVFKELRGLVYAHKNKLDIRDFSQSTNSQINPLL